MRNTTRVTAPPNGPSPGSTTDRFLPRDSPGPTL
jgi:hypothetical protein